MTATVRLDSSPTTFRHAPELDGLRGIAVAAVVVYHLWADALPGGFIGVDVFFVLSGFLLSALLVRESEANGRIHVGRFFVRRVRRLLPATLLVLLALAGYAAFWAEQAELQRLREHTFGALTYSINWLFIADGTTYTDVIVGTSPLRHMWSLAIEEQFYVVLALGVALLVWTSRAAIDRVRLRLGVGALVLAAASAIWMIVLEQQDADLARLYFGTDTRAQAMLVGVALGAAYGDRLLDRSAPAAPTPRAGWRFALAACVGVVVLAVFAATGGENERWMFSGGFTLVAAASGAVIVGALGWRPFGRVLALAPLRLLGVVSYGVYLWHWPVLVIADEDRLGLSGGSLAAARIGLTIGISALSYAIVEAPIRRGWLGARFDRRSFAVAPLAIALVTVAIVATTQVSAGDADTPAWQTADDPALSDPDLLQVAVLGDSVLHTLIGGELAGSLTATPWNQKQSSFDRHTVAITTLARPACSFLPGEVAFRQPGGSYETADLSGPCRDWRADLVGALSRPVPVDVVMVLLTNDLEDRFVDGSIVAFGTPEWDDLLLDWLNEVVGIATGADAGVVLVATAPRVDPSWQEEPGVREAAVAELFEIYATAVDGVETIDLADTVGSDTDTRYDGLHYTDDGARSVAAWLTPQLAAVAAQP